MRSEPVPKIVEEISRELLKIEWNDKTRDVCFEGFGPWVKPEGFEVSFSKLSSNSNMLMRSPSLKIENFSIRYYTNEKITSF